MRDKRYSLVVIVILLIIFLPLTVLGYLYKEKNIVEENPNHDFFYQGKYWFYDENNNYLSKYECLNKICEIDKNEDDSLNIISNSFVFIKDGEIIKLFDIKHNQVLQDYLTIDRYDNDEYVLKDSKNVCGSLYIKDVINVIIPFEYDAIIKKDNNYIVKKDNWYLIDDKANELSKKFEDEIVDFTNKYVITTSNNYYKIFSYNKEEYLNNIKIEKYIFKDKYIGVIYNNILYVYNDLNGNPIKIMVISSKDSVSFKYENSKLNIYEDNKILDSI